jgi:hypothetical protein
MRQLEMIVILMPRVKPAMEVIPKPWLLRISVFRVVTLREEMMRKVNSNFVRRRHSLKVKNKANHQPVLWSTLHTMSISVYEIIFNDI